MLSISSSKILAKSRVMSSLEVDVSLSCNEAATASTRATTDLYSRSRGFLACVVPGARLV